MKAFVAFVVALFAAAVFSGAAGGFATISDRDVLIEDNSITEELIDEADSSNEVTEVEDDSHWYITRSDFMLPYDEADGRCFWYVQTEYVRNTEYGIAFHTYEVLDTFCWSDN